MKLIVGLGNPGKEYSKTRHNIGFMFVDSLASDLNLEFKLSKKHRCFITQTKLNDEDVMIIKPITFMNLSGESVVSIVNYYKINIDDILVIHDDMDLKVGSVRIRKNGSSGGQKGMNNIIEHLHTNEIKRIRIGIDKNNLVIDHVLGEFTKEERNKIDNIICVAKNMIMDYLKNTFDNFMSRYNHNE